MWKYHIDDTIFFLRRLGASIQAPFYVFFYQKSEIETFCQETNFRFFPFLCLWSIFLSTKKSENSVTKHTAGQFWPPRNELKTELGLVITKWRRIWPSCISARSPIGQSMTGVKSGLKPFKSTSLVMVTYEKVKSSDCNYIVVVYFDLYV
jgi:hypothetical protein